MAINRYQSMQLITIMTLYIGSQVMLSRDGKIAVASSIIAFAVASIAFFFIGFLSGNYYQKKKRTLSNSRPQIPYYDDVVLQEAKPEFELKENVAYAPAQLP